MRKEKSWTRQQYEAAYSFTRRVGEDGDIDLIDSKPIEIWKAADYSYQARDYVEMGWSGEMRRHRFHAIKHRILTQRKEVSF